MFEFFKYLPYLQKASEHEAEITQLTTLLGPTVAEFKKVSSQVIPLATKLAAAFSEVGKK